MKSLVEEVYEPSLIDHALFAKLTSGDELFLVTIRANHLDIYTCSLHSYDESPSSDRQWVSVDPEGRLILIRIDSDRVALLGVLHQLDILSTSRPAASEWLWEEELQASRRQQASVMKWRDLSERLVTPPLAACFLPGYIEPCLVILYEPEPTWPNRVMAKQDTKALLFLSRPAKPGEPWRQLHLLEGLSSDLCYLHPIGHPHASAVVLSGASSLLYAEVGQPPCWLPLNGYARSGKLKGCPMPKEPVILRNPHVLQIKDRILLSGHGGSWWLRFERTGRTVSRLTVEPLGDKLTLSLSAACSRGSWLFMASLHAQYPHGLWKWDRVTRQTASHAKDEDELYLAELSSNTAPTDHFQLISSIPTTGTLLSSCLLNEGHLLLGGGRGEEGGEHCGALWEDRNHWPASVERLQRLESSVSKAWCLDAGILLDNGQLLGGDQLDCAGILEVIKQPDTTLFVTKEGVHQLEGNSVRLLQELNTPDDPVEQSVVHMGAVILKHASGFLQVLGGKSLPNLGSNCTHICALGKKRMAWMDASGQLTVMQEGKIVASFAALPSLPQVALSVRPEVVSLGDTIDGIIMLNEHLYALVHGGVAQISIYRQVGDRLVKQVTLETGSPHKEGAGFEGRQGRLQTVQVASDKWLLLAGNLWLLSLDGCQWPHLNALSVSGVKWIIPDSTMVVTHTNEVCNVSMASVSPIGDSGWTRSAQPLLVKGVVRHVCRHDPSGLLVAACWNPNGAFTLPDDEFASLADNLEWKPPANVPASSLPVSPLRHSYSLQLLTLEGGVKLCHQLELQPGEEVSCMRPVLLESKQTSSGVRWFVAVGTVMVKGEDRASRGRVLIAEVVEVVPEEGRPETAHQLRLLAAVEQRGPVTCLAHLHTARSAEEALGHHHLLVGLGPKAIVCQWTDDSTLTPVAFLDIGVQVMSAASLKNFILMGDLTRGLGIYAYQPTPPTKFVVLGRDAISPHPSVACEWLVGEAGTTALLVSVDYHQNVWIHSYAPDNPITGGGMRLLSHGGWQLGDTPIMMHRHLTDPAEHGILISCSSGRLISIRPLESSTASLYQRLALRLTELLPPPAGITHHLAHRPLLGAADCRHQSTHLTRMLLGPAREYRQLSVPAQEHLAQLMDEDRIDLLNLK